MIGRFRKALSLIRPQFYRPDNRHLSPYLRFTDYKRIWGFGILALGVAALLPLIAVTIIHFRLIQKSIDAEIILLTERVTSNARRAVTYFLEEHLNALRFTVNEFRYDQLTNPDHLKEILRNLKNEKLDVYVIVMTGYSSVRNAVDAMKLGAFDYLSKPFTDEELLISVERAVLHP